MNKALNPSAELASAIGTAPNLASGLSQTTPRAFVENFSTQNSAHTLVGPIARAHFITPTPHQTKPQENFSLKYKEYKTASEATLEAALKQAEPANLLEQMRYVLSNGGKRVRPVLTMLACGAVGGNPFYAAMGGVVIEVLHNFTLVHDDIMDEAPLRRGLPTIHTKWNCSTAILSGDAMMAFAYKLLLKHYALNPRFIECADLVTRAILEVCEGQVSDMEFQDRAEVSMPEYITMIEKKTARMLELCVTLGTVLGNGSARELAALKTFARSIGIAFQILDDVLDATATAPEFGKTLGGDIIEGKKTFLVVHALENRHALSASDNALLEEFIDNKGLPRERVSEMVHFFERNHALEAARDAVELYTKRAHQALENLPAGEHRTMLHQFSTMLLQRCS